MTFTRSESSIRFHYQLAGSDLQLVSSAKDLGVIFNSDFSFKYQVDAVYSRAVRTLGFIKRTTFNFRHVSSILYLYKTLVLPLLTYCSSIWSPYQQIYINKLEEIQHKLLRYLALKTGNSMSPIDHDYSLLYSQFNFSTIRQLHSQIDAKIAFKLVHNLINSPDTVDGFRNRNLLYNLRTIRPLTVNSISNNYWKSLESVATRSMDS